MDRDPTIMGEQPRPPVSCLPPLELDLSMLDLVAHLVALHMGPSREPKVARLSENGGSALTTCAPRDEGDTM